MWRRVALHIKTREPNLTVQLSLKLNYIHLIPGILVKDAAFGVSFTGDKIIVAQCDA